MSLWFIYILLLSTTENQLFTFSYPPTNTDSGRTKCLSFTLWNVPLPHSALAHVLMYKFRCNMLNINIITKYPVHTPADRQTDRGRYRWPSSVLLSRYEIIYLLWQCQFISTLCQSNERRRRWKSHEKKEGGLLNIPDSIWWVARLVPWLLSVYGLYSGNCIAPLYHNKYKSKGAPGPTLQPPCLIENRTGGESARPEVEGGDGRGLQFNLMGSEPIDKMYLSLCEKYYQNHHKSKRIKYAINLWSWWTAVVLQLLCALSFTATNRAPVNRLDDRFRGLRKRFRFLVSFFGTCPEFIYKVNLPAMDLQVDPSPLLVRGCP